MYKQTDHNHQVKSCKKFVLYGFLYIMSSENNLDLGLLLDNVSVIIILHVLHLYCFNVRMKKKYTKHNTKT